MASDPDVFVGAVKTRIRRSLFTRLRGLGLPQDDVTRIVSGGTLSVMDRAGVNDLAALAVASRPVVQALREAAPESPVLAEFDSVRLGVREDVAQLFMTDTPPE